MESGVGTLCCKKGFDVKTGEDDLDDLDGFEGIEGRKEGSSCNIFKSWRERVRRAWDVGGGWRREATKEGVERWEFLEELCRVFSTTK